MLQLFHLHMIDVNMVTTTMPQYRPGFNNEVLTIPSALSSTSIIMCHMTASRIRVLFVFIVAPHIEKLAGGFMDNDSASLAKTHRRFLQKHA